MVSALAFALLAADPAARLDAFLKARPDFIATTEYSVGGRTVGRATLRLARPGRLRFEAKGAGFDYALSSTEKGYVEFDRIGKVYDEFPATNTLARYESRLSGAGAALPSFLLARSTGEMFHGTKPAANGEELRATLATDSGPVEARLLVGPEGNPVRYSQGAQSWRVLSFAATTGDLARYALAVPLGYVPFALPDLARPLAIGSEAPLAGWRFAGKPLDLGDTQRGRPRLLALLGDDAPSRAARAFLIDLGKTMPVFLLGTGEITDPSGSLTKRLSPPGTPMFYLVGGDGKVKALWFGFERPSGAAWEAEVREAAAK